MRRASGRQRNRHASSHDAPVAPEHLRRGNRYDVVRLHHQADLPVRPSPMPPRRSGSRPSTNPRRRSLPAPSCCAGPSPVGLPRRTSQVQPLRPGTGVQVFLRSQVAAAARKIIEEGVQQDAHLCAATRARRGMPAARGLGSLSTLPVVGPQKCGSSSCSASSVSPAPARSTSPSRHAPACKRMLGRLAHLEMKHAGERQGLGNLDRVAVPPLVRTGTKSAGGAPRSASVGS